MDSILYRINRTDSKEVSLSIAENGLLEISMSEDSDDEELEKCLRNISAEDRDQIVDRQKKHKEDFRKKAKELIHKHANDFKLNFSIDLQIRTQTKKVNDCRIEMRGITFSGKMLLSASLQYMPDDMVEKFIRCTVYVMALDYERLWSKIKYGVVSSGNLLDPDAFEHEAYLVPEKKKYKLTYPDDEIKKIQADYKKAAMQYSDMMKQSPIGSINLQLFTDT